MSTSNGLIYLRSGGKESCYRVYEATVPVKDGNDYQQLPVSVELVISHAGLRRLITKAFHNKSKRSSDGPLIVHITNQG